MNFFLVSSSFFEDLISQICANIYDKRLIFLEDYSIANIEQGSHTSEIFLDRIGRLAKNWIRSVDFQKNWIESVGLKNKSDRDHIGF